MGVLNSLYQLQMNILSENCEPCIEPELNHLASSQAFEVTTTDGKPKQHQSNHRPRRSVILVLSGKEDESIFINGNIKFVVAKIQGRRFRLGIEAPQDVPVHRQAFDNGLKQDTTEDSFDCS